MKKGGRSKRLLQFLWDTVLNVVKPIDALPITPLIKPSLIALAEPIDWDEDVVVGPTETYDALVRSIARTAGFGMFFVRCVEGDRADLIARLRSDLPRLKLGQLVLDSEVVDGNLYRRVQEIVNQDPVNVLCISGLEKSFDPYVKSGYGGVGDYYHKDMVPRVLGHLNLQRERFRDDFPLCFIFFLSTFGIKFIARRSPDFFDWRSGIFEFVPDATAVKKLTQEIYGDYTEYLTWTHEQRIDRIRQIQCLIDEDQQSRNGKAGLFIEKGNILYADKSREEAIASYDKVIEINPDYHSIWLDRGGLLDDLGRKEEAIASYDKAIEFKPDKHEAYYNRACSYSIQGDFDRAISDLSEAIRLEPEHYRKLAATDSDFEPLREDSRFLRMLN